MNNKVTLGYWAIRGLAERIRMIMEYTGLEYDQTKYTPETREKWFKQDKAKLAEKNPAITLPFLIDGDQIISESDGIIVYVVHKSGKLELLGRNCDEQTRMATVMGVVRDLHPKYVQLVYGRVHADLSFEEATEKEIPNFKPFLEKLNKLLEGRQYYAGQITWVDFAVAEFMQCLWHLNKPMLQSYANIWAHQKRIWDLPAIKAYHETDRFQESPKNNAPYARWA